MSSIELLPLRHLAFAGHPQRLLATAGRQRPEGVLEVAARFHAHYGELPVGEARLALDTVHDVLGSLEWYVTKNMDVPTALALFERGRGGMGINPIQGTRPAEYLAQGMLGARERASDIRFAGLHARTPGRGIGESLSEYGAVATVLDPAILRDATLMASKNLVALRYGGLQAGALDNLDEIALQRVLIQRGIYRPNGDPADARVVAERLAHWREDVRTGAATERISSALQDARHGWLEVHARRMSVDAIRGVHTAGMTDRHRIGAALAKQGIRQVDLGRT